MENQENWDRHNGNWLKERQKLLVIIVLIALDRHGCLTALLGVMLVANSLVFLLYAFMGARVMSSLPVAPAWILRALLVLSLANVVFVVALLRWKKWGFWGFAVTCALGIYVNINAGIGMPSIIMGILGLTLLFATLQIGKENKGWTQLE